MALDESLFDSRIVERNIRKGLITREDYEKYLDSLDDSKENAEPIESEFEENVLEDDEEEGEEVEGDEEDE